MQIIRFTSFLTPPVVNWEREARTCRACLNSGASPALLLQTFDIRLVRSAPSSEIASAFSLSHHHVFLTRTYIVANHCNKHLSYLLLFLLLLCLFWTLYLLQSSRVLTGFSAQSVSHCSLSHRQIKLNKAQFQPARRKHWPFSLLFVPRISWIQKGETL